MAVSRRQFLKGLLESSVVVAAGGTAILFSNKDEFLPYQTLDIDPTAPKEVQLLMSSYFPMLRLNEGESFTFYRCPAGKVSVGYGTNLEANPSWFKNVSLYKNGEKLSEKESEDVLAKMKKMDKDTLKYYAVSPEDALKLAGKGMRCFIEALEKQLVNPKTKKSILFDLPIPMQALALDVIYNVGPGMVNSQTGKSSGFKSYKKLKEALIARDFNKATEEAKVYVDRKTKAVNLDRERRKKRLVRVMRIVHAYKEAPSKIAVALQKDYEANVPALSIRKKAGIPYPYAERSLNQKADLVAENEIAKGELERMRRCRERILNRSKTKTSATQAIQTLKTKAVAFAKNINNQGR